MKKQYFKILDGIAPRLAAGAAYHHMSNPRNRKLRAFEEKALDLAVWQKIQFGKWSIQSYQWGEKSDKIIFLVHGWEGHAGNFGALIDILISKGYYVLAFDGPSHGRSSRGKTSMFEYAAFISEMLLAYRPSAIISHSFGSVTTVMALTKNPEVHIKQWFAVTTPHNFKDRINEIKKALGASDRTVKRLIERIEAETKYRVDEMNMDQMGPKLTNVKEVIIIHSRSDKFIPIEDARKAHRAIPQSTLIELDHIGHYAILWSEELKRIISQHGWK